MLYFKHNQPQNYIKILDYTYTSQPSINSALPLKFSKIRLIIFIILCILSLGFVWLLARWSKKRKAILLYSVCEIQQSTEFLITQQDVIGCHTIVKRIDRMDIRRKDKERGCMKVISFCYQDRNFLYHDQKDVFLPIRYEDLGIKLDKLKHQKYQPYYLHTRNKLLEYYGVNQIQLNVQNYFEVFIQEMLTPYQVFQLYAILLWIYQEYYIFSVILLAYSLYTYWQYSYEVVQNQRTLARKSYFNSTCKVLTKSKQQQNSSRLATQSNSQDYSLIQQQMHQNQLPQPPKNPIHISNQSQNILPTQKKQNIEIHTIQFKNILPGDIIILKQGTIVPCDCLIIYGEALVDQSYTTGQNYLIRKQELNNYQYSKDLQKTFLLYLGTTLVKVSQHLPPKTSPQLHLNQLPFAKNSSLSLKDFLQPKQIACLVTQTNYNTQRGKYLRAIRYQKKYTSNFTTQTIYFIYIILIVTIVVFIALIPKISQSQSLWNMLVLFIDLLSTSIPITLPTALNVGIKFAKHRLSKTGIHSILPSNIISGGRATTIVLHSSKVLGKNCIVSSIVTGTKANNSIGNTYSSLSEFLDLTTNKNSSPEIINKQNNQDQINNIHQIGKMLLRALVTCHSLQRYNNQLSGTIQQKHLFQFAQGKYLQDSTYQCLKDTLTIKQKIYFKEKDKKLAVVVQIKSHQNKNHIEELAQNLFQLEQIQQEQSSINAQLSQYHHIEQPTNHSRLIFIKGPPEKIIQICKKGTYPQNYHDYIVDIAQKGFKSICYAYRKLPPNSTNIKNLSYLQDSFTFCGFALLQPQKQQDTIKAILQLKQSKMQLILLSQQRELQVSSIAINNKLCTKNSLILCSMHNNKIKCSGHLQWQSTNTGQDIKQLILQSDTLFKNTYISLNSILYQELFMKKDERNAQPIFMKTIVFNQMDTRHSRNVYFQLDKRNKITFAISSGASVSQCAHLSLQLQRGECSMLSSFHTSHQTIKCIPKCLSICRAALSTNFHCFSMMILFSLIQFTTVVNLYYRYQNLNDQQYLYEDLFVTFPIFVTINLTSPVDKLSKELPPKSFFSLRALTSMIGQFIIQLITQILFTRYLSTLQIFQQDTKLAYQTYISTQQFPSTPLTQATFILTNYLYLGIVLSTSVSKPFRKPFYTNIWYTCTLSFLWLYNTAIVLLPSIVPQAIRQKNLSHASQQVLVHAMLLGNLMMIIMYMYQNILVWVLALIYKIKNKNHMDLEIYT